MKENFSALSQSVQSVDNFVQVFKMNLKVSKNETTTQDRIDKGGHHIHGRFVHCVGISLVPSDKFVGQHPFELGFAHATAKNNVSSYFRGL